MQNFTSDNLGHVTWVKNLYPDIHSGLMKPQKYNKRYNFPVTVKIIKSKKPLYHYM